MSARARPASFAMRRPNQARTAASAIPRATRNSVTRALSFRLPRLRFCPEGVRPLSLKVSGRPRFWDVAGTGPADLHPPPFQRPARPEGTGAPERPPNGRNPAIESVEQPGSRTQIVASRLGGGMELETPSPARSVVEAVLL